MSTVARRGTELVGRWGTADVTDPRLLQVGFAALMALDLAFRATGGARYAVWSLPVAGMALGVLATVVALALPWSRLGVGWLGALAVLDIAAIGLLRLSPEGSGAIVLITLPALWLGRLRGWWGTVVCGAAATALVAIPGLVYFGPAGAPLSRSVLPAVVAVCVSAAKSSADEVLGRQRRVTEAVLDSTDVGMMLLDDDGRYETTNRALRQMLRLAFPDGHRGRAGQLGQVFDEETGRALASVEMPSHRASRGEEFEGLRIWIGEDPARRRALSVSARRVSDDRGRFVGAVVAYTDVTDLVRALEVKDEFVASVSHELRTPLTSIVGYVQLLQDRDDLPADAARQLQVVERNAARLLRLIADLLHSAQADRSHLEIDLVATDLARIVREAAQAAAPAASAAGLELRVDVPDAMPATVDASRIAQVVDNLLSNAVKYTPAGGTVAVGLTTDAGRAVLSVSDSGPGIPEGEQERLFTRFFRTDGARASSVPGVGLGLSIAQAIVVAHGGRIELESRAGEGATFRVRLPLSPV